MPLISLVIVLIVVGVLMYLVNTLIPIDGNIKKIINVVVGLAVGIYVLLWFMQFLGVSTGFKGLNLCP